MTGPMITPRNFATSPNQGGGQALPPYLQGRTQNPAGSKFVTSPMITPKASVTPGEVTPSVPNTPPPPQAPAPQPQAPPTPAAPQPSATSGASAAPQPAAPAKPNPQTLYDFFKQDLEDQRKLAEAGSTSDAAARGVYYGTPLTTSLGDINTQYLRGLGQLQAGIIGNESNNELARLGLGSSLLNSSLLPPSGGLDPSVFQTLGSLFGQTPAVSGARSGPTITPAATTTPPRQGTL